MKTQSKKIKDIEIYSKQYLVSLSSLLIIFNLILWSSLILLVVKVKNIFTIVISFIIFIFCLIYSIYTFLKSKKCHNYQLYEDYIKVTSLLNDETVNLVNIIKVVPKVKVINSNTKYLVQAIDIYYLDKNIKKTTLRYIKEDVYKLAYLISVHITKVHKKLNKINSQNMQAETAYILNKTTDKLIKKNNSKKSNDK